ncbi:unnamed protein product [Trichobilharzia regenti]|nr:unnamed protein product [Trichobilharzia regenti]
MVARISSRNPSRMFDGYVSRQESERKVIRNVLRKGDMWFASGDLMCCDEYGYIYFVDRLGDTYRWRGENVSTAEVERILDQAVGSLTATVYGVCIPGTEGKAGMAAIALEESKLSPDEEENLISRIHKEFTEHLPPYARPIFLRLCQHLAMTGKLHYTLCRCYLTSFFSNVYSVIKESECERNRHNRYIRVSVIT